MFNFDIISEYRLQIVEINKPNIIFRNIKELQSFCIYERNSKMFKTQTVIEFLLKTKVFQFALIFHFDFNLLGIINIFEPNVVPLQKIVIYEFTYLARLM
jgi:hypothetical protein